MKVNCTSCGRFCKATGDPLFMTVYVCFNHINGHGIVIHCEDTQDPTIPFDGKPLK